MKIVRYKRKKPGVYTIYLEKGFENDFYEEVILEYELLLKKEVSEKEWKEASLLNHSYDCYYTALRLLNKMAKSKSEVASYLRKKEYQEEEIENAIKKLEQQGYLNDLIYAKSYVHNKIASTLHGPNRIRHDLEEKGILSSFVEEAMMEYTKEIEEEKIASIISKNLKANHNKSENALKRKIESNLIVSGFSPSLVREQLSSIKVEKEEEIAKKEYTKIYNRLCKKYKGRELDYKVKQKMYALGFRDFDVSEIFPKK